MILDSRPYCSRCGCYKSQEKCADYSITNLNNHSSRNLVNNSDSILSANNSKGNSLSNFQRCICNCSRCRRKVTIICCNECVIDKRKKSKEERILASQVLSPCTEKSKCCCAKVCRYCAIKRICLEALRDFQKLQSQVHTTHQTSYDNYSSEKRKMTCDGRQVERQGSVDDYLDRNRNRNRDKDRGQDHDYDNKRDRDRDRDIDRGQNRYNENEDRDNRGRDRDGDRDRNLDGDRHRNLDGDHNRDRDRNRGSNHSRNRDQNRFGDRNRNQGHNRSGDRNRDRDSNIVGDRNRGSNHNRPEDRNRDWDSNIDRDHNLDRDDNIDRDHNLDRASNIDRNRNRNRDRDWDDEHEGRIRKDGKNDVDDRGDRQGKGRKYTDDRGNKRVGSKDYDNFDSKNERSVRSKDATGKSFDDTFRGKDKTRMQIPKGSRSGESDRNGEAGGKRYRDTSRRKAKDTGNAYALSTAGKHNTGEGPSGKGTFGKVGKPAPGTNKPKIVVLNRLEEIGVSDYMRCRLECMDLRKITGCRPVGLECRTSPTDFPRTCNNKVETNIMNPAKLYEELPNSCCCGIPCIHVCG